MTATVTDINEFRAKKQAAVLREWSNEKVVSRYNLLEQIENGADFLTNPESRLVQMAFPNGFNPVANAEDNITLVRAEAKRRGVELS